ncbi:MAG: DUF559 domain-containing protein [Myxococcales bacterium]|nr:DUF559 domain-containing protein [Myxococcales bacterium]
MVQVGDSAAYCRLASPSPPGPPRRGHAKFRRQQPLGRFIVDFFCEAARLVVEVDGGHHDDPSVAARDAARDALLRAAGLTVLRLPNEQILHDPERALDRIRQLLRAPRRRDDTR